MAIYTRLQWTILDLNEVNSFIARLDCYAATGYSSALEANTRQAKDRSNSSYRPVRQAWILKMSRHLFHIFTVITIKKKHAYTNSQMCIYVCRTKKSLQYYQYSNTRYLFSIHIIYHIALLHACASSEVFTQNIENTYQMIGMCNLNILCIYIYTILYMNQMAWICLNYDLDSCAAVTHHKALLRIKGRWQWGIVIKFLGMDSF